MLITGRKCKYCQQSIVWGLLMNGRRRSFEPKAYPAAEVAEGDRFAVSKRYNRVVDLVAEPRQPDEVLVAHRCLEYAKARMMHGVTDLSDELRTRW